MMKVATEGGRSRLESTPSSWATLAKALGVRSLGSVRTGFIVVFAPLIKHIAGFDEGIEQLAIQAFNRNLLLKLSA